MIYYFKDKIFSCIAKRPWLLSCAYGSRKKYQTLVVNKNTDIVIEGFPRSANSYAVLTFENAQRNKVIIAHHIHAQAQFLLARKYNIPAIVLIREPLDAIASLLIRDETLTIKQGIQRYIDFYQPIFQMREHLVIASFATVIANFSLVVAACNKKFGSNFTLPARSEQNEANVFSQINTINTQQEKSDWSMLAMPHINKVPLQENIKGELQENILMPQADELFKKLVNYSC